MYCISSTVCNTDLDPLPFDCREAYVLGCTRSGVYTIDPGCGDPFSVWCDMSNGREWTVFQRWRDGSVDFYRGWTEYENGFSDVKGEHWLGLKNISCLTGAKPVAQLRVDLADFEGRHKYAHYSYFSVGNPSTNYTLSVGGYSGTAGDSLTRGSKIHNGRPFTTHDSVGARGACARAFRGAWWYEIVTSQTSMDCTSVGLMTPVVWGGPPSTQLLHLTHWSGLKWNWGRSDEHSINMIDGYGWSEELCTYHYRSRYSTIYHRRTVHSKSQSLLCA